MKDRSDLTFNKNNLFKLLLIIKEHLLLDFREYYKETFLLNFRVTIISYK